MLDVRLFECVLSLYDLTEYKSDKQFVFVLNTHEVPLLFIR